MATPLSPEVWDIIVAQLPPPEPKLVPMIYMDPKYHIYGRILISKAVSEKETFMILDILEILEGGGSVRMSGTNDVYWSMVLAERLSPAQELEDYFVRARDLAMAWTDRCFEAARAMLVDLRPFHATSMY